jgi:hypothetical protein
MITKIPRHMVDFSPNEMYGVLVPVPFLRLRRLVLKVFAFNAVIGSS